MKNRLIEKIRDRTIQVGVIGLGYVGLPLAVEKAKSGFKTIGFDIQREKVELVNRGENYIGDVIDGDVAELVKSGMLQATSDYSFLAEVDFIAICVPTPLDVYQQPDISYVMSSSEDIATYLRRGMIVVLESTTYPGTTEELIRPILEKGSRLKCGVDFYLGFSPERVDPGNQFFKTKNTPKVVGAIGDDALEVISVMYEAVLDSEVFRASSPAVAEMEKILENTYRNINIGLVNELAILCNRMGIDIWEVIEAASTKPYGFQAFYPGPGLGGHCIPLDPYYLSWKAREYNFHTSMIESSMMINDRMPEYCVERVGSILNVERKALNGSKILALGVAYKSNIDDFRESPAIKVIELLKIKGAIVEYFDPYIAECKIGEEDIKGLISLKETSIPDYDLVIVLTGHSDVDYESVCNQAQIVFDTRNACRKVNDRKNVILL